MPRKDEPIARLGDSSFGAVFPSTHWSVVLAANGDATPAVNSALETLFRTYQRPLYAYIRRRGNAHHDAEDLLQAFFGRILAKDVLRSASQARGQFRSFLLTSLKNFLSNEFDRSNALKRGGGQLHVSFDTTAPASITLQEPACEDSPPDKLFDREWAAVIFAQALAQLEQEFVSEGKQTQFNALAPFLSRPPAVGEYERVAGAAGIRLGLMATAVSRLRERFRDLVRAQVAATVSTAAEVNEELSYLVRLIAS